jgi:uncharacterized membrane protein YfbV (UPF0208 family)
MQSASYDVCQWFLLMPQYIVTKLCIMAELTESFWKWTTSALLAGLLGILTITWQSNRSEKEAMVQLTDWKDKAQDGRLTGLETRQDDVRNRLATIESKHTYETMAQLVELRKRIEQLERTIYKAP